MEGFGLELKMICLRITKYNPLYRNTTGNYEKDEWISFFDIGKIFEHKELTLKDYLIVENAYINTLVAFMECSNIDTMRVRSLEKQVPLKASLFYPKAILDAFNTITNGMVADKELIKSIGRLVLREDIWCKLEAKNMYVHFGYDYYMYIGTAGVCSEAVMRSEKLGLFVESYDSPYSST
jgi:hypothetical protein